MPLITCPMCAGTAPQLLEGISADAIVLYFRCSDCHHVWAVDKHDPSKINHVTPMPETAKV